MTQPPAVIHIDLDGASDIFRSRGWKYGHHDDPLFASGVRNALDLFERNGVRATFFVIADSLDDPCKRELLREVVRRGHEIASHSLTHPNLRRLDREQKRREIVESREALEETLGIAVRGFRAPGYQIDRECLELLAHHGYAYDASAFATPAFARYLGVSESAVQAPARLLEGQALLELPLPDHRPSPVPFNPSYAILLGLRYFRTGIARAARRKTPLVLLFHLVDVAEGLPRQRLHGWKSSLFTLSFLGARRKLARCQRMLDVVRAHYGITHTTALVESYAER